MKKKLLFMIMLMLLSIFFVACTQNEANEEETTEPDNEVEESEQDNETEEPVEEETPELDKEQAKEVLVEYKETFMTVIENTEDDGSLTEFESKEELKEEFMSIMSEELADTYITHYFEEEDNKLYVIPTELPEWFDEDKDFTLEQVDDLEYEVSQEVSNDLIGNVRMTYVITAANDSWIVNEVKSENLNEENEETNESGQNEEQGSEEDNSSSTETDSGEITESVAEDLVRDHLQIPQDSEIRVVADHKDENDNFVVQVYEIVSDGETSHTATIGWYIVDKDDGTVEEMM